MGIAIAKDFAKASANSTINNIQFPFFGITNAITKISTLGFSFNAISVLQTSSFHNLILTPLSTLPVLVGELKFANLL